MRLMIVLMTQFNVRILAHIYAIIISGLLNTKLGESVVFFTRGYYMCSYYFISETMISNDSIPIRSKTYQSETTLKNERKIQN